MRNKASVSVAAFDYPVGIVSRVSSIKQAEKESLNQQDDACLLKIRTETPARAGSLPIRILDPFRDNVSGDGRYRAGLERAKQIITAGQMRELWVYNPDRLGRDMRSILEFISLCLDHECRVFFVQDEVGYDEAGNLDATSKLIISIKAWVAEQEKIKIKERTANGRLGLVQKGIQPQRARAPYGYKIWQKWEAIVGACSVDDVGRYAFSPDLLPQQIVTEIFERVARRETMRGIADVLQKRGVPSPSGGTVWYIGMIRVIVKGEIYKGIAYYGRRKAMTDKRREAQGMNASYRASVPRAEWKSFPAPRMVSDELWQTANDALADNRQFKSGNVEQRFLLSGLLRCPKCGASMGGRKNGKPAAWYYICNRDHVRMGKHYKEDSCSMRGVRSSAIELRVAEALREACGKPTVIQMAIHDYMKAAAANVRSEAVERDRTALRSRKDVLTRKTRALRQLITEARMNDEAANVKGYQEDLNRESAALEKIEAELRAIPEPSKAADRLPDPLKASQRVASMLQRLPEALASTVMTIHEKRILLDAIVLCVKPIEEALIGKRVDWSVDLVLKPEIWQRAAFGDVLGVYDTLRCGTPDASPCKRREPRNRS